MDHNEIAVLYFDIQYLIYTVFGSIVLGYTVYPNILDCVFI